MLAIWSQSCTSSNELRALPELCGCIKVRRDAIGSIENGSASRAAAARRLSWWWLTLVILIRASRHVTLARLFLFLGSMKRCTVLLPSFETSARNDPERPLARLLYDLSTWNSSRLARQLRCECEKQNVALVKATTITKKRTIQCEFYWIIWISSNARCALQVGRIKFYWPFDEILVPRVFQREKIGALFQRHLLHVLWTFHYNWHCID